MSLLSPLPLKVGVMPPSSYGSTAHAHILTSEYGWRMHSSCVRYHVVTCHGCMTAVRKRFIQFFSPPNTTLIFSPLPSPPCSDSTNVALKINTFKHVIIWSILRASQINPVTTMSWNTVPKIHYEWRSGHHWLTPSTPAVPNCCCSKDSAPYWSNPPFLIFDIRVLWRSGLSARAPECQKLKMAC